jgi:[protein-PII] uridylyltransferase
VVEVITRDRPELLLRIAAALQQMNLGIAFAKINTEGDRVADIFYVSEDGGGKVTSPDRLEAMERRLYLAAGAESLSTVLAYPRRSNAATAAQ